MSRLLVVSAALLLLEWLGGREAASAEPLFVFRDVGQEAGLFPALTGIQGHSAGWGDMDGDGWLDLYVGTFARTEGKANLLFRNVRGKFQLDTQPPLQVRGRCNSSLFVDLDNDGDLDLYVSSMPQPKQGLAGCSLFRNDGQGKFTDISPDNGACPLAFGGRSATVLDFDGDGLLDLLVGEEPLIGYNGSTTKSSRLFRNQGSLQFADVSAAVGLTPDVPGLGVAAGDVNGDSWPDFFLCAAHGGNRLFLNDGRGKFAEAPGTPDVFDWYAQSPPPKGDDTPCGVCFGDVNRDGRLDVVIGHHFQRPWNVPVFNRLYLNRGQREGRLVFEDVTEPAGLKPLTMKAPHVELRDFDNDGWPDLYSSLVKFAEGKPHPLIYRNLGVRDGLPRFEERTLGVNDFPTAEDKAVKGTTAFFDKMIKDGRIVYSAPGPAGDFDNDGRIDLFLANWWVESPSLLLRNETPSGHWLKVEIRGVDGVNRMGIGTTLKVYTAGQAGDPAALLACQEISTGYGYTSGQEAVAHFGLGKVERVDVEVILPHGKGKFVKKDVSANQRVTWEGR